MQVVGALDRLQRRHRWAGVLLAVVYKFVEDQGGFLAALIAFYGFVSLFPLLLLATTVVNYLVSGDPDLQQRLVGSALNQFPVLGGRLEQNVHSLHGSWVAVAVGVLGALWGGLGVGQAAQHAFATVWAVPMHARPDPLRSRLRSLRVLAVGGLGVAATTGLSGLTTNVGHWTGGVLSGWPLRAAAVPAAIVLNTLLYLMIFRVLGAGDLTVQQAWPGALAAAVGWQVLQTTGTYWIGHELRGATGSYGVFGVVLGLVGFLYLAATMLVLCAELNVVLARRLWPRALLGPFSEHVEPTAADRRAWTSYVTAACRKGFQRIRVAFPPRRTPTGKGRPAPARPEPDLEPDPESTAAQTGASNR